MKPVEQRGVGVAQVVEPEPGQVGHLGLEPVEELAEGFGVDEPAGGVDEHPVVDAVREPIAREPATPPGEDLDGAFVDVDAAATGAGLDRELDGLAGEALEGPADREPIGRDVQVGPLEPGDLSAAHSGVGGEVQGGVEAEGAACGEEGGQFVGCPGSGDTAGLASRRWRALVA
jgi:hypothetical protein